MDIQGLGLGIVYVIMGMVALLASKLIKDAVTPFRIDDELTVKDNPAYGLVLAGYFAGVTVVYLGACIGPVPEGPLTVLEIATLAMVDFAYALLGIVLLLVGRVVLDRVALPHFDVSKEILQDRNVGTGAVAAGSMMATALTVAGAIHGQGGGLLSALVFFVLGQIVLVLYVALYQRVVRYDVHAEIEKDNVAAGVALGLNIVAMGIILLKGTSGDLYSWTDKLTWFGIDVGLGLVLLLALRQVTDAVFLPNTTIGHEIAEDRNVNAAWIEGVISTSLAALIFFVV